MKYGMLTLVTRLPDRSKTRIGLYRCDCGREKVIRMPSVEGGQTRSCGCQAQRFRRGEMNAHYTEFKARRGAL